jgi:hypothetical protein
LLDWLMQDDDSTLTNLSVDALSLNLIGLSPRLTPLPNPPPQGGREPDEHGRLTSCSLDTHHIPATLSRSAVLAR